MTQEEFAISVGLSPASWWQVLSGRRNLGWKNAKKIGKAIGTEPHLWREGGDTKQRRKVWDAFRKNTA